MATDNRATDRMLPSLPQILLRILEAIQTDQADFHQLATILHQDPAMLSRLLSVANSSFYNRGHACDNIERALLVLGTDAVRTIAITAAIKQYFSHFGHRHHDFLRHFWRRSLLSATLAQALAHLTRYSQPDEAYLCGLLADVGRLQLLSIHGHVYRQLSEASASDADLLQAERKQFAVDHCETGAALIDGWNLSGFISDAVRYHHEPPDQIVDAHHLVKIVNLASVLSANAAVDDPALEAADQLFGLTESLTRELLQRTDEDVERIAGSLGIDTDIDTTRDALGEQLSGLAQLSEVSRSLLHDHEPGMQLQQAVQRAVYMMLGIEHVQLFSCDLTGTRLASCPGNQSEPVFDIPLLPGRSLVSDAVLERRLTHSEQYSLLPVVDRQLRRHCGNDILACLPLIAEDLAVGALALGLSDAQLTSLSQRGSLLNALGQEISLILRCERQQELDLASQPSPELRIREAVHEAGNPLSIIRNYLEMLRHKLGNEHEAHQDLQLIRQELDRVGHILLRLQDPEEPDAEAPCNANALLEQTGRIFERSILSARRLHLVQALDQRPISVNLPGSHFKQIITNLLKNAAEALPEGGTIRLESEADISFNGECYARITISDDGPGISEAVKKHLFTPTASTKIGQHGGLGLSVVKRLMDENGGMIVCKSDDQGTQFQLLLPITP